MCQLINNVIHDLSKEWIKKKMEEALKAKTALLLIFIIAFITAFILAYIVASWCSNVTINNQTSTIKLLKRENEHLKKIGAQTIEGLEIKIIEIQKMIFPLTTVAPIDPITGEIGFGQSFFIETDLTMNLLKALELIDNKKYDLAISKAEKMDKYHSFYLGSHYIRFLVNQAKGYKDEAAKFAELIVKKIPAGYKPPEHHRIKLKKVYAFKIDYTLSQGDKKRAEEATLKALELWPNGKEFTQSFEKKFGYKPAILKNK